jgi:hypothetical protein
MRRLPNIYSINQNRPNGMCSVPKVAGNHQGSASQPFGTLIARNVALGRTSQRVCLGDGTFLLKPLGRMKNVPKSWNVVVGMVDTKYLLEPAFAFAYNPSGRFLC